MKTDKLIEKYYKNLENENLRFIKGYSLTPCVALRMSSLRNKIINILDDESVKRITCDDILNKIDNNRKLKKLAKVYNGEKTIESLQMYISYKNKLAKRFGFNNFQEILEKKLQLYSYSQMNLEKIEQEIKKIKILENKDCCNFDLESTDLKKLLAFEPMVLNLYKDLEQGDCILEDESLTYGALSIYMPMSKKGIILLRNKKTSDFDFIAHELGHLLEYLSSNDRILLHSILLVKPTKEFYASFCEVMSLKANKDSRYAERLLNEFFIQIKVLYLKIKFEEFLYTTRQGLTELNLKGKWDELIEKFFQKINFKREFKWNSVYNISEYSFDKWMYFLGKFFASQASYKTLEFTKIFNMVGDNDFAEILKMTNFTKGIDI